MSGVLGGERDLVEDGEGVPMEVSLADVLVSEDL